jgi:hypothetical protein
MPKVGMHKHVREKLEGLEVGTLNIVEGKPLVQRREHKGGHQKNSDVDQQ